jgi:hypothetical protein
VELWAYIGARGRNGKDKRFTSDLLLESLYILTSCQTTQVDRYLADMEEFGRIILIKRSGKLRLSEKTGSVGAMCPDH